MKRIIPFFFVVAVCVCVIHHAVRSDSAPKDSGSQRPTGYSNRNIAWDIDHVLLRDGSRLKVAMECPHKWAILNSLQPPLMWGALNVMLRYAFCLEASMPVLLQMAKDHQAIELRNAFIELFNAKEPNEDVIAIARQIKREHNCPQFLASNMPKECFEHLLQHPKYAFFTELFDIEGSQFLSRDDVDKGAYKPQAAYFENLLARIHSTPQDTIFVDNKDENTSAAEQLGMPVIHASYKECHKIRQELSAHLGVEIPDAVCSP